MNAYAVKPTKPFVTKTEPERIPATEENKEMVKYLETHSFSLRIDKATGKFIKEVDEKK